MTPFAYPTIGALLLAALGTTTISLVIWLTRPIRTYTGFADLANGTRKRYTIYARSAWTARLILQRLSHRHHPTSTSIVAGLDDAGELV